MILSAPEIAEADYESDWAWFPFFDISLEAAMSFRRIFQSSPALRGAHSALYWSPLAIALAFHIFELKTISGRSMQPTLNPDWSEWRDVALFDRTAAWFEQDCNRDDVIVLKSPLDAKYKLIKRIIAVEGDVVKTLPPYPVQEVVIPKGHVWVEGDDHYNSDDSNLFGPVPRGLIESKLLAIVWPIERSGLISKPVLPQERAGPAFRRAMAAFERERARRSRVTTCN